MKNKEGKEDEFRKIILTNYIILTQRNCKKDNKMGNFDEIRSETKRLLREGSPSLQQYEDALSLCKELYEAFPETHELWDVQQYANCLKRLNKIDEAEQVCENIYAEVNGAEIVQQQNQAYRFLFRLFRPSLRIRYRNLRRVLRFFLGELFQPFSLVKGYRQFL